MPTREEIITLAERLARREHFNPAWITYPDWAGYAPDIAPILEKAKQYKEQARAILAKTLPPPEWPVEEKAEESAKESPEPRDPTPNAQQPPLSSTSPPGQPSPGRAPPLPSVGGASARQSPRRMRMRRCPTEIHLFDN